MIPDPFTLDASTPSPRCGRMEDHDPHPWTVAAGRSYDCPGSLVTEGATACFDCRLPTRNGGAYCVPCQRGRDELAAERGAEWHGETHWSER